MLSRACCFRFRIEVYINVFQKINIPFNFSRYISFAVYSSIGILLLVFLRTIGLYIEVVDISNNRESDLLFVLDICCFYIWATHSQRWRHVEG